MIIEVISGGKRCYLQTQAGAMLSDCLLDSGFMEGTECGGQGVCGKCAVKVLAGELEPIDETQAVSPDGKVLACRAQVVNDVVIEIASGQDDVKRKVGLFDLCKNGKPEDGPVQKQFVELAEPTLRDQLSDLERILAQVGKNKKFPHSLLPELPGVLRQAKFAVTAVLLEDELIAVEPGDTREQCYGFVIDVGTTTIATYLVDLHTGEVLEAEGLANPQRIYGSDVLTRIAAASTPESRRKMQKLTIEAIAGAMRRLMQKCGVKAEHAYIATVVGNTTMSHLFLGVDPANLAVAPFIPCYRSRVQLKAKEIGLPIHPEGAVHVLPNISGYVGSDTVGVAMVTKFWEQKGFSIAVDIGTNGEIILGFKGRILACSAAAGPAFEGAHIQQGMRAGEGAIEKVRLDDDTVELGVIGSAPPQGICGSGLIDAVAELLRVGLLDKTGKLVHNAPDSPLAKRVRKGANGVSEFVLAYAGEQKNENDLVLTQKDIRELQLAKAAIAAGIQVLKSEVKNILAEEPTIDRVYLAGAFGNYLDREKAVALGLFPGISVDRIIPIGNAAAEGAGICLLSVGQRKMADRISMFVTPVELSVRSDFNELWVKAMGFPKPDA